MILEEIHMTTYSKIFQHNSYTTLNGGFYKGTITLENALKHGNIGIGTLDGADGEVIILDGIGYHGSSENVVRTVKTDETLPYVAMVEHMKTKAFDVTENLDMTDLMTKIISEMPAKNTAYTISITGTFKTVTISSKPANNTKPYAEILANQPYFTAENIEGTAVGIWSPSHLSGLYGNGAHLHFLSRDKTFGAHISDFLTENVHVEIGQIREIQQEFAVENDDFQTMEF